MASVASQLKEEVTEHAQSDSLEDVRELCADGTYFPNNLRTMNREIRKRDSLMNTKMELCQQCCWSFQVFMSAAK